MSSIGFSCSCGACCGEIFAEPQRVSVCYCMSCRKRTGSVIAAQARFLCSDVSIEGSTHSYRRYSEDGAEMIFDFCPACGSTIRYTHSALVDQVIIPLGVIDQTEVWQPTAAIYNARRPAWLPHNEHIEWID